MAELGLVANIAGVVGAGLALSKVLYDFASVLGSASRDIKGLATDISLFCSVLKHVQTTLNRAKSYRLSMTAVQTAEDVIDRCHLIFTNLQATIDKLRKGDPKLDLLTRVKWFFKEKRILLVHEQLKTCTATLHLMLTTLMLAQKIANKRLSTELEDDENSQDRLMTHALFMAQQAANERLTAVEDEVILEDARYEANSSFSSDLLAAADTSDYLGSQHLRRRRNRSSQMIYGAIHSPSESLASGFDKHRRVSVVVGKHLNRLSLFTRLPTLDETRLSVLQTDELLRNWTDQSDPLAFSEKHDDDAPPGGLHPLREDNQSPRDSDAPITSADADELLKNKFSNTSHSMAPNRGKPVPVKGGQNMTKPDPAVVGINMVYANKVWPSFTGTGLPGITPNANAIEQTTVVGFVDGIFKTFRVTSDDPTWKVLPKALKRCGIRGDWRQYHQYAVYIVCDNHKRLLGLEEKPLTIYKDLERNGEKPMFMLRKLAKNLPMSQAFSFHKLTGEML